MGVPRPWQVLAGVSALAGWLDFSRLQEQHHADSLVPVLAGLTAWTPFFWGQDRFGMLIPLLALPVREPFAHLLVQGFLVIGLSAWGLLLLVRSLLPDTAAWVPPAALLLVLLLLLAPVDQRFNILWVQPYTLSFGLGLSAMALSKRPGLWRRLAATVLYLAAAWVNVAVALVVGPLVLWRALFIDSGRSGVARWRHVLLNGVLLIIATFFSARLSKAVALPHTRVDLLPRAAWRMGATQLLSNAAEDPHLRIWVLAALLLAAGGLLSLASVNVREKARPTLLAAAGLALTALVPFAAAATSRWVADNGFGLRYLTPPLLLLQAACCLLATLPLLAVPVDWRARTAWAGAGCVAVALLLRVGPPSRHAVLHAFESRWGASARDVVASRATHVTGDYWKVWPTVFYADVLLGRAGRRDWPYGITDRSIATLDRARVIRSPRVAALDGYGMYLGLLGPRGWTVAERHSSFLLLTTR
jgi:hypothetical protein